MNYEQKYKEALERASIELNASITQGTKNVLYVIFPELQESEDERIRKVIYGWIYTQPSQFFDNGFSKEEMLAWVEKQGEQIAKPHRISVLDERMMEQLCDFLRDNMLYEDSQEIISWLEKYKEKKDKQSSSNIPSRETILAVWELGNEWKDLTKGVCDTEHGTQLKYIQNHWQESSYYDNIMEGGGR